MAIVQVSRITNRKGLSDNLPQLAGAELGWAIDTRRLYIGNGTLEEGAPIIGNTEILTEFSDVLALSTGYVYKGEAAGYVVQTGPSPGSPISQSIQSWMDQWASVRDFGAVGDGVTDDTDAINRALYQLFCREINPQIRRSLFFPAGIYLVRETIVIPPYAKLWGEGLNSSVIQLTTSSDLSSLSRYCARFGDSLQQTGVNIGNNGATPPTNIEISSLGFSTTEVTDVFLVEDANTCSFTDVGFTGPLTKTDLVDSLDDIACVRFAGTVSLPPTNIAFTRCKFSGTTWATNTAQRIKGISFSQSYFDTLYQGALFGDPSPVNGGPTGVKFVNNVFDNIYKEGIYIAAGVKSNVSSQNIFFDVGNHFNGTTSPQTPVINFVGSDNISVGDMFERAIPYSFVIPRVEVNNTYNIAFEGAEALKIGKYVRETGYTKTLLNNTTSASVFFISTTIARAFKVDYTVIRDTAIQTGSFTVVSSTDGAGTNLSYSDSYVNNISTGVTFAASESAGVVSMEYTTTNTGQNAFITFSITHLA